MGFEIKTQMLVREVMSSPVISAKEETNIVQVAKLMKQNNVGAIIIVNLDEKPVGIVTERDLVNRVIAEGKNPRGVLANKVMSSPLKMVESDINLMEAMHIMDKMNIRRLGVLYKEELVGIITDRNIIRLIPTIFEIMKEQQQIKQIPSTYGPSVAGYCDRCEKYSYDLRVINGDFLCEDCHLDVE
jgi:CBS domain-containing protein